MSLCCISSLNLKRDYPVLSIKLSLGLLQLLPEFCSSREDTESDHPEELSQVATFYSEDLPHPVMLPIAYRMWVLKWSVIVILQKGLLMSLKLVM